MQTNALPRYDQSDNPTGCCPRFKPEDWDGQELHFEDKLFLRATTRSENHVPIDMAEVLRRVFAAMEQSGAYDEDDVVILSRDVSASEGEHFVSVSKPVPGEEAVRWSGDYVTKVFEGPYQDAWKWERSFGATLAEQGREAERIYFFYTTCPKCAEVYGKNYVVAVAKLRGD